MTSQIICLALVIVLSCPFVSAQWVHTNGPFGGSATCFAVSGMNLFAGSSTGVFLSTNSGTSWNQVKSGLTSLNVLSLAANGANLFAGTDTGGIFLSANNGTSWIEVNNGLPKPYGYYPSVLCFAVSGANLFAGSYDGVFLSTNNGTSWTEVNTGLTNTSVMSLAVSGINLFAGTYGGVFLSTNNGTSWTEVNTGLTNPSVMSLAVSGTNLFAGTHYDGVFLSTNNGTNWTEVNQGLPSQISYHRDVLCFAVSGTNLFAGTSGGGVFLSTNNGTSWTEIDSGLIGKVVYSLCTFGTNLLAGTGCGLFISVDKGSSWNFVHAVGGSRSGYVHALAVRGAELFAGASWGGGRGPFFSHLFHSTDNGDSWVPEMVPGANAIVILGTDVFAGTDDGVFLSTNNGTSWAAVNNGLPANMRVGVIAISGTNLFAGGDGVFLTTDSGASWTGVSVGLADKAVRALAVSGTNLFAGTESDGVFLSTNNGTSWAAVNNGLPANMSVGVLAVSGTNLFAGGDGVFLTTNDGESWTTLNTGLTIPDGSSLAVSGRNLFAGSFEGLYLSTDNGTNWQSVSMGLNERAAAIVLNDTYVFVGTGGMNLVGGVYGQGVWRRPLSEMVTSVQTASIKIPHAFELSQNYPNPFNPSTIIAYELPRASHVTLTVHDVLGREVVTLVNERKESGTYNVQFNAGGLPSGVYFYRIQAGDFVQTKKLLLLH